MRQAALQDCSPPDNYDEHSIDWSPDGKEIAFLSSHEQYPGFRLPYDIFAVDVATGKQRQITNTPGVAFDPHVSPDGNWVAYTATKRVVTTIDSIAEDAHVWVAPLRGGFGTELTAQFDWRCSNPRWTSESQRILFTASDHGKVGVSSVFRLLKRHLLHTSWKMHKCSTRIRGPSRTPFWPL